MKVLIQDDSGQQTAHFFIRMGLARALAGSGHDVALWDTRVKSAIDMFDEYNPDLFIGTTYGLDRGIIKSICERPSVRVVLLGSNYSSFADQIDLAQFPILNANENEIRNVEYLNSKHKIDFIYGYYHWKHIPITHEYWNTKLGIKIDAIPLGGDISEYTNGRVIDELKSDITNISGYWPFKAQIIDRWFIPLCNPELGLDIKVFGNKNWPIPQYYGNLDGSLVRHAFKSAKLNVNISEPHAHSVFPFEINERIFKLLLGKNQVLSDYTESIATEFFSQGEVQFAKSPQEFKEKALAMVSGSLTSNHELGYNTVMNKHTYFSRIEYMFDALSLPDEAENVRMSFKKIREENNL